MTQFGRATILLAAEYLELTDELKAAVELVRDHKNVGNLILCSSMRKLKLTIPDRGLADAFLRFW